MADPMVFVAPPRREARRGGIKSLGEFVTTERLGAAANINYISNGCSFPSNAPGLCWGTILPGDKTPDGIEVENGITSIFAQYAGVECFVGVGTTADYSERARRLLVQTEEHELEAVINTWGGLAPSPGAGVTFVDGIAQAEAHADQNYVGRPVIFMNRGDVVHAAAEHAIDFDREGNMWTPNGTPVVASWAITEHRVIAIGMPTVYASDIEVTTAIHHTTNVEMAIAERVYGLAVDCLFRYLVDVTV